jgi:hypothetical protein
MKRIKGWEKALGEYIERTASVPFAWGAQDCCLWVCDAIGQYTEDADLGAEFRGKYSSAVGAAKVMVAYCGGGVEQLAEKIAAERGISEVAVMKAQRGDVVLVDTERGPALGLVALNGSVLFARDEGLGVMTLKQCRRAWRI